MPAQTSDRIDLNVTFGEKDQAKKLGARWDSVNRTWWTTTANVLANPALYRWMDAVGHALAVKAKQAHEWLEAAVAPSPGSAQQQGRSSRQSSFHQTAPPISTRLTDGRLPACSCSTPPWEDCEHTAKAF